MIWNALRIADQARLLQEGFEKEASYLTETIRRTEEQRKEDERKNAEMLRALERQRKEDEVRNKQRTEEIKAEKDHLCNGLLGRKSRIS